MVTWRGKREKGLGREQDLAHEAGDLWREMEEQAEYELGRGPDLKHCWTIHQTGPPVHQVLRQTCRKNPCTQPSAYPDSIGIEETEQKRKKTKGGIVS